LVTLQVLLQQYPRLIPIALGSALRLAQHTRDLLESKAAKEFEGGGKLNIFVMNADGSNPTQLTHFDVPDEAGDTNWSGDGKKIAFEYDVNGMKQSSSTAFAEVWTMNADGSDQLSTGVQCADAGCSPRWQR
jgi:Tol biopolymer transport system component